jgi:hypothetical protein
MSCGKLSHLDGEAQFTNVQSERKCEAKRLARFKRLIWFPL